jgi:hypothetical protein
VVNNNESNLNDKGIHKNRLDAYFKHTTSILDKIKLLKTSNKKNSQSFSQVDNNNNDNKEELGFSIEGLKNTSGSIDDTNGEHSQMNDERSGTSSIPLDSKQPTNRNIDLNEIDKIQNDILKTLKRLGDS